MGGGVRTGRPQASRRNSRGLLCRNGRVVGTEQCVRGGRNRKDYPGGESSKRAGGAGGVVCRKRPQVHADRPGSRATVAVVACGADGGGAYRDPDRDAAPQGGAGRDEGEDRSQRRARHGPADPDGLVPSGSRKGSAGAGSSGTAERTRFATT